MTYLFDFDGVIVDSMPVYAASMIAILEETGTPYPENIVNIITPLGTVKTAEYYVGMGVPLTKEQILQRMGQLMCEAYFYRIPAKEGAVETVRALKAQGHSVNVLTAGAHITMDACLKRIGLWDVMDHVWSSGEDFDLSKTDPEIYHQAAKRLGVAEGEVLFLDDNIHADRAAKQAGMRVCGVYDPSSAHSEADMRSELDGYIRALPELLKQK